MNDTRSLLNRIAALRQRLDQAPGLARSQPMAPVQAENGPRPLDGTQRVQHLERQVAVGQQQHALIDGALRQLPNTFAATEPALPTQLTARARWVLGRGRELLAELRTLADEPILKADRTDPLAERYRATAAMADSALRMVQAFPDTPSVQLRLCEGLEAILAVVAERVAALRVAVEQRRREADRIDTLADLLTRLEAGATGEAGAFRSLAEAILDEAHQGAPLRFLYESPRRPARFIACHSLTVAQVMARLVRQDPEWRGRAVDAVLAALVYDAGMLRVPAEILVHAGPLNDDQRRTVESHPRLGAELARRLLPEAEWLADAAANHHERIDGTGYPFGLHGSQLAPLTRLLAVCDVYVSLCTPRPQRPALQPRTALTDTLLLAEKGELDSACAERLLLLSFYPVGCGVELADGAIGLVVATPMARRDLNTPARPVVVLLTDGDGKALALPQHVDLAQVEGRTIVRTLTPAELRGVLGERYPELTR